MKRELLRLVSVSVLALLSACTSPLPSNSQSEESRPGETWIAPAGQFADYHDFVGATFAGEFLNEAAAGTKSAESVASMAQCFADAIVAHTAPKDLEQLNAAARGAKPASKALTLNSIEWVRKFDQSKDFARTTLRPFCPETFDKYGKEFGI